MILKIILKNFGIECSSSIISIGGATEQSEIKDKIDEAKRNVTDSRKNISNIKRRSHERNVALYEVANEKLNCSDIFDEAQLNGSNSNPLPNIEEYGNMINIHSHLNDDGTVDETFLQNWEKRTAEYTGE